MKRLVADGRSLRPFSQEILAACFDAANQVYAEIEALKRAFQEDLRLDQGLPEGRTISGRRSSEYNYDTFMMIQQRNGKL